MYVIFYIKLSLLCLYVKKRIFYREWCYVLGLIIMAFASAFTEKANLGMSMVIAPTYILHLKVSEFLPWFSFGVAEYVFQGFLVLLTIIIVRKLKLCYLFSFVTAISALLVHYLYL